MTFWNSTLDTIHVAGTLSSHTVRSGCDGSETSEVRAVLMDADRTTVLWVSASGDDASQAEAIAELVIDHVTVDPEAVPREVAANVVFTD